MTLKKGFVSTWCKKCFQFILPVHENSSPSFLHKIILPWMLLFKLCGYNPITYHVKNGKLYVNKTPTYILLAYSALVFLGNFLNSCLTFAADARKLQNSGSSMSLIEIVGKTMEVLTWIIGPFLVFVFSWMTSRITRIVFSWKDCSTNYELSKKGKVCLIGFNVIFGIIAAFFSTYNLVQFISQSPSYVYQDKNISKMARNLLVTFLNVLSSPTTDIAAPVLSLSLSVYFILCFDTLNKGIKQKHSSNKIVFRDWVDHHVELSKLTLRVGESLSAYLVVLYSMHTLFVMVLTTMAKNKSASVLFGTSLAAVAMANDFFYLFAMTFCCVLLSDKVGNKITENYICVK